MNWQPTKGGERETMECFYSDESCGLCGREFTAEKGDERNNYATLADGMICLECKEEGDYQRVANDFGVWYEKYLSGEERAARGVIGVEDQARLDQGFGAKCEECGAYISEAEMKKDFYTVTHCNGYVCATCTSEALAMLRQYRAEVGGVYPRIVSARE